MKWQKWQRQTALFIAAQNISITGSQVVSYAVTWYITLETSSGWLMTVAILCSALPQLVLSPLGGVWADRYNRKLLIIAADAFTAVASLILALLWLAGHTSYTLLFVIMAVRSLGGGIQSPAVGALLPQLAPAEALTRVNAINVTLTSALSILAPALGGVLLGSVGFFAALLFDVITAALAVAVMSFLQVEKQFVREEKATAWREMKDGFSYVAATPWLRSLLLLWAVGYFLITPGAFLSPILVERVFGNEVWMLTVNEISWSLGAVVGGLVVAAWGGFANRVLSMAISLLATGVTFFLTGVVGVFPIYLVVMLLSGSSFPLFSAASNSYLQQKTDPAMMGRVYSLISLMATAVMPLAMLVFGPLADIIDVRLIMIGTGLAMCGQSIYILASKKLLAYDKEGRPELARKTLVPEGEIN